MAFYSMTCVRNANDAAGQHWFDPSTMRFFRSRVGDVIYQTPDGGALFVSSEQRPGANRMYTVRYAAPDGRIDTVGHFQQYATPAKARHAAKTLAPTYAPQVAS